MEYVMFPFAKVGVIFSVGFHKPQGLFWDPNHCPACFFPEFLSSYFGNTEDFTFVMSMYEDQQVLVQKLETETGKVKEFSGSTDNYVRVRNTLLCAVTLRLHSFTVVGDQVREKECQKDARCLFLFSTTKVN